MKGKIAEISQQYKPDTFLEQVPESDATGATIPQWKRLMMAKKLAEKARKDAEQKVLLEMEAKKMNAIPVWKRNLINKKDEIYASPAKIK